MISIQNSIETPHVPSPELAEIVGAGARPMTSILQAMMKYVRLNGLQDPSEVRFIRTDAKLMKVCEGKAKVSIFELAKIIHGHVRPQEPPVERSTPAIIIRW